MWDMEQAICDRKKTLQFWPQNEWPLYLHTDSTQTPLFRWRHLSGKSIQGELRCNEITPPDCFLIFIYLFIYFYLWELHFTPKSFKKYVRGKWQSPMIAPAWLCRRLSASSRIRTQLLTAYPTAALKGRVAFQCKTTDTMAAIYFSDRTIYGAITINHCRGKEDCLTHPEPPYKCNSPTAWSAYRGELQMHFAHARAQSYTGMAISCVDLISVCRMHFLGGVISPQGSAGGCHESRLYCRPPLSIQPPSSSSSSGQSPARQQDLADPAAGPDYIHASGCRLDVTVQSGIQFVFLSLVFSGCPLSSETLSKWLSACCKHMILAHTHTEKTRAIFSITSGKVFRRMRHSWMYRL